MWDRSLVAEHDHVLYLLYRGPWTRPGKPNRDIRIGHASGNISHRSMDILWQYEEPTYFDSSCRSCDVLVDVPLLFFTMNPTCGGERCYGSDFGFFRSRIHLAVNQLVVLNRS